MGMSQRRWVRRSSTPLIGPRLIGQLDLLTEERSVGLEISSESTRSSNFAGSVGTAGMVRQALLSQYFCAQDTKEGVAKAKKRRKRSTCGDELELARPNTPEQRPKGDAKVQAESTKVDPTPPNEDPRDCEKSIQCEGGENGRQQEQDRTHASPKSNYELMREERIRKNLAQMEELGLLRISENIAQENGHPKTSKRPQQKPSKSLKPLRRSSRVNRTNTEAVGVESKEAHVQSDAGVQEEHSLQYVDSSVKQYVCKTIPASSRAEEQFPSGTELSGYTRLPHTYPLGNRVYSVDDLHLRSLLAVGGHQGHTAIYSNNRKEEIDRAEGQSEPLLSFRSHRGWVSDVQFTSVQPDTSTLLLTSSNDATLKLWDLNQTTGINGQHVPKELVVCDTLHTGGIFSMHELAQNVLTASKDSTCVLSHVSFDGKIEEISTYDNLHTGVIKCVRWRDHSVFGTSGKDRQVCLVDKRAKIGCVQTIENVHAFDVNIIEWDKHNDNFFLTASFDQFIHLRDVRAPQSPVYSFKGHMFLDSHRCRSIYHPVFVNDGNAVVVSGERSGSLTIYSTKDGSMISQGHIGFDAFTLYSSGGPDPTLYAAARHSIQLFQPRFD